MSLASKLINAASKPDEVETAATIEEAVKATATAQTEVERIEGEIASVKSEIEALETTALAETGNAMDGKRKAYDAAVAGIAAATDRLGLLERARRLAEQKLVDAKTAQLRAAGAARRKDIQRVLASRANGVAEAVALTEQLVKAWDTIRDKAALLRTSWPTGEIPPGGMTHPHDLHVALAEEFLRISGLTNPLPGAFTGDFNMQAQPERLRPLAAKIAEADEYLLRTLDGQPAKPRPAPAPAAPAASPEVPQQPSGPMIRAEAMPRATIKLK
jgi:hypothetical protein